MSDACTTGHGKMTDQAALRATTHETAAGGDQISPRVRRSRAHPGMHGGTEHGTGAAAVAKREAATGRDH